MQIRRWRYGLLGCSAVITVLVLSLTSSAIAQDAPNQSDITGTNVGDYTNPTVYDDISAPISNLNGLDTLRSVIGDETDIGAIAQDISRALDDAYSACVNSASAAETPRRFARGPAPTAVCTNPECDRLNRLVQETRTFLSNQTAIREQLRVNQAIRLW
jgi:hypothetical protein